MKWSAVIGDPRGMLNVTQHYKAIVGRLICMELTRTHKSLAHMHGEPMRVSIFLMDGI